MMKIRKYLFAIIIMAAVITVGITAYAGDAAYDDDDRKIFDYAGLLSDGEEKEISEKLAEAAKSVKLDLVVVTTEDTEGKTTALYADDFFDDNGFGYDKERGDGVLFLIDMEHRQVFISTSGKGISYVSDDDVDSMLDEITPCITEGRYADGVEAFIDGIESVDDTVFTYLRNPFISIVIALAVSGIAVLIMSMSSKTKVTVGSRTYMKSGSFNLSTRTDHFTHTTTTRRKIETDNDNSGGGSSSVRTSSSGNSHGGGGRSF